MKRVRLLGLFVCQFVFLAMSGNAFALPHAYGSAYMSTSLRLDQGVRIEMVGVERDLDVFTRLETAPGDWKKKEIWRSDLPVISVEFENYGSDSLAVSNVNDSPSGTVHNKINAKATGYIRYAQSISQLYTETLFRVIGDGYITLTADVHLDADCSTSPAYTEWGMSNASAFLILQQGWAGVNTYYSDRKDVSSQAGYFGPEFAHDEFQGILSVKRYFPDGAEGKVIFTSNAQGQAWTNAPEPSTIVLFVSGLSALVCGRGRLSRHQKKGGIKPVIS